MAQDASTQMMLAIKKLEFAFVRDRRDRAEIVRIYVIHVYATRRARGANLCVLVYWCWACGLATARGFFMIYVSHVYQPLDSMKIETVPRVLRWRRMRGHK